MAAVAEPTYMLVDRGEGLEPSKKKPEGEPEEALTDPEHVECCPDCHGETPVSRMLKSFAEEVDKTVQAGEDAVKKTRQAVFTARKRGSVQNLKAISSPPPPKADEE